jgi:hypothetical protein
LTGPNMPEIPGLTSGLSGVGAGLSSVSRPANHRPRDPVGLVGLAKPTNDFHNKICHNRTHAPQHWETSTSYAA